MRRQHLGGLCAETLVALTLFACVATLLWRPTAPATQLTPRAILDERGHDIALREPLGTQAVFMGIGAAPYLFAARDPAQVITSRSSANDRLTKSSYLRRAFPDLPNLRTLMYDVEIGGATVETLLASRPGVVVTWARLAGGFERVGLAVAAVKPVSTSRSLADNTALFAGIVDSVPRGRETIARAEQARAEVAALVASRTRRRPRLLVLYPRGDGRWQAGHVFRDIVAEAGGLDVGANVPARAFLDAERLLVLAPDVIVIIGAPAAAVQTPRRLMATPALATLSAVRSRRVYVSPPGFSGFMMTSIEVPIYARWLADILHPDELSPGARTLATRLFTEELGVAPTPAELDQAFAAESNGASAGAGR